jgi:F0F1-type ATP synthase membrane subunit b/b'
MTKATGGSTALRKADAVIARRAAEIRQHENTLRDVIAQYFRAQDQADAVRADTEATIARLRRDADVRIAQARERGDREAAGFEQQAHAAVRRMLELGESRHAIEQATGLRPAIDGRLPICCTRLVVRWTEGCIKTIHQPCTG